MESHCSAIPIKDGRLIHQALLKKMNIKLDKKSEALVKEMLRKNSRYGSVDLILNEAVGLFLLQR